MRKVTRREALVGAFAAGVAIATMGNTKDPQAIGVSQSQVASLLPSVKAGVPAGDKDRITWIVVIAMLRTTTYAEGLWERGRDAYRTQYSYRVVPESYAYKKHPYDTDGVIPCGGGPRGERLCSAASGAYQFMPDTWNPLRVTHKNRFWYPGDQFSPENQDLGAIYLMGDIGMWPTLFSGLTVKDGKPVVSRESFARALAKAASTWASFPRYENDDIGALDQSSKRVAPLWKFFQQQIKKLGG